MVHSLSFLETKYATQCTQLVGKYVVLNNMTKTCYYSGIQFSQCDISINISVVLNIPWYKICDVHSSEDS